MAHSAGISASGNSSVRSQHQGSPRPWYYRYPRRATELAHLSIQLAVAKALWKWRRSRRPTRTLLKQKMANDHLPKGGGFLTSCLCSQEQLESETFRSWIERMGDKPTMHRKQWEFGYIAQALYERGLLELGSRGLGFAVGREPLPSLFARFGCEIVASDWSEEAARAAGWVDSNQHASNLEVLNERGLCPRDLFLKRVTFRTVDMNQIPGDLRDFDFVWSSCSLEHLGSIRQGEQFIYNAMKCLRPGGVAVHTTEFNVSSNRFTLDHSRDVVFRQRDIERIAVNLAAEGHDIQLNFAEGEGPHDHVVDVPPYRGDSHLKLLISHYVCTSIGLIIQRDGGEAQLHPESRTRSEELDRTLSMSNSQEVRLSGDELPAPR